MPESYKIKIFDILIQRNDTILFRTPLINDEDGNPLQFNAKVVRMRMQVREVISESPKTYGNQVTLTFDSDDVPETLSSPADGYLEFYNPRENNNDTIDPSKKYEGDVEIWDAQNRVFTPFYGVWSFEADATQ